MFKFNPFEEKEAPWFDVAQICPNDHVTNSTTQHFPQHNKEFCDKCGQRTITACPSCGKPIRGKYSHLSPGHQRQALERLADRQGPGTSLNDAERVALALAPEE